MQVLFAIGLRVGRQARWTADVHLLQVKLMRVLLLNLSGSSVQEELRALQGEGYVLFTVRNLGVDEIISSQAQVLIAEATPSDLSCCHLINQIKSDCDRPIPKIALIVYGGAIDRFRALELGADDVVSAPIDAVEFSARIKTQIQTKQSEAYPDIQLPRTLERDRGAEGTFEASTSRTTKMKPQGLLHRVLVSIAALITICDRELTRLVPRNSTPAAARRTGQVLNRESPLRNTEQARVPSTSGAAPETNLGV